MPGEFPLPQANPGELNFLPKPLHQIDRLIRQHIAEGRYPGCQIALARHGKLALFKSFGNARHRAEPGARRPTTRCGCSTPTPRS